MRLKVSVPCLFYSPNIKENIIEICIEIYTVAWNSAFIGRRFEERIVDRTSVLILYSCYRHFIAVGYQGTPVGIRCEIDDETSSRLVRNKLYLKGASFSLGILTGMFLLYWGRQWPKDVYVSAELKFDDKDSIVRDPKIMPIGAASQKAAYVLGKKPSNTIYMPYGNVQAMMRSRKWQGTNLKSLPKQLTDALSLFDIHTSYGTSYFD